MGNKNRSSRTSLSQIVLLLVGGLFFGLLLLEACLHLLPVNELLLMQQVNEKQPVLRFAPNRTLLWSKFADFSMQNEVRVNNYGFLNDQDYVTQSPLPLVAVIGDSFVEASMVPYPATIHGRLAGELKDVARVYSYGVSGAPLSQYLQYADWARKTFNPEKMVFIVVGNDFDESLVQYKRTAGLHFFRAADDGYEMERVDYTPGWGVWLVTHSKLLMYLAKNVEIFSLFQRWRLAVVETDYVGQTKATADAKRLEESKRAVDEFFRRLPQASGLGAKDLCFVLDGMRPHLYSEEGMKRAAGSYYDLMREYFLLAAAERGYQVLDMQPRFQDDFQAHGERFEYSRDGHWNDRGHGLAAEAVVRSGFLRDLKGSRD